MYIYRQGTLESRARLQGFGAKLKVSEAELQGFGARLLGCGAKL